MKTISEQEEVKPGSPVSKSDDYTGDPTAFKTMIDIAPDPIIMIKDKKVIYGNKKALELIGYTFDELVGMDFLKFVAPSDHFAVIRKYVARMAGFKTDSVYEVNVLTKNDKVIPSEVNALQIKYFGNTVDFVILRDITDRKKQEELLRAEKEEADRLNKMLVGRELKMVELKQEVDSLKTELATMKKEIENLRKS
jgi:PAS domain S-box-containing protein